uniref:Uncharacterized protein n=1 Tax=viral metagenome TaxID=1070528 RepID=A0A6C0HDR5_9ZZZZ
MSNKISTKVKEEILVELVEPCYKTDIKELINERKFWRKTGNYFESASKVFIGASSIVSFASGIYDYQLLSFFSGTTGVLSLVCMQFSSYSYNESKERTSKLNKLLDKLKIDTVPDISDQPFARYQQTPYTVSQTYSSAYQQPPYPVVQQYQPVVQVIPKPEVIHYNQPSSKTSTPPQAKRSLSRKKSISEEKEIDKEVEMTTPNIIEDEKV